MDANNDPLAGYCDRCQMAPCTCPPEFDDPNFPDFLVGRPVVVPFHVWRAIQRYVFLGDAVGGFLTYLFAGDLFMAACNADAHNRDALGHVAHWIATETPVGCHGSMAKVIRWRNDGGLRGVQETRNR